MKVTFPYEVRRAKDAAENARADFLRQHGWVYTCATPGSFWLWSKTMPDGRVVLCPPETAFAIEEQLTPDPDDDSPDPDSEE